MEIYRYSRRNYLKTPESYLNIKEKFDKLNTSARDLKKEIVDELLARLDTIGESKAVFITCLSITEKGAHAHGDMICKLHVTKVMKIGKARIVVISIDHDKNEYENDIRDLSFNECMSILKVLYTVGAYVCIPFLDMIERDDEDNQLGPGEDIKEI